MLMVQDILPGISCFISFVYYNLRSTMVAALSLMLLSTPPLTSIMATPMIMQPSCTSTVSSTSPSSSSSSQECSPAHHLPDPVLPRNSVLHQIQPDLPHFPPHMPLPMLILVGCIIGACACGIALAAHNMWKCKTKQKQRRNDQQRENQHSSAQDVVD